MPTKFQKFLENIKAGKRLDFYIFEETLGVFLGSCIFVLFILLMFQCLRLAEFFIIQRASGILLLRICFFMLITFLPVALPLSFLIAILITFGRLSADSELVAMKASGISLFRLSYSVWFLATLVVTLAIALNLSWVPWAEVSVKNTELMIGNTRAVSSIKEGTFTSGFFNLLIFADKTDSQKNRLYKVFIYDEREAKNPLTYVSREAEIVPVKTSDLGAAIVLRLYDGSMHHNDLDENTYEKVDFSTYNLYLKVDGGNHGAVTKPQMIPYLELTKKIDLTTPATYEGRELRGEYWRRIATAISPFIFVLVGIGFGTFRSRSAKTGAVLTGFIILVFYWLIQAVGVGAVQRGNFPAYFAMQLPNLILLILGLARFKLALW